MAMQKILSVAIADRVRYIPDVVHDPAFNTLRRIIRSLTGALLKLGALPPMDYVEGPPGSALEKAIAAQADPDTLIFTVSDLATRAAQAAVRSGADPNAPPIVFAVVSDPVEQNIVTTETGVRTNRTTGISTSLLQTILECAHRFCTLSAAAGNQSFTIHYMHRGPAQSHSADEAHKLLQNDPQLRPILQHYPLELNDDPVKTIDTLFPMNLPGQMRHGFLLTPDALFYARRDALIAAAHRRKIPTFVQDPDLVDPANPAGPIAGFGLPAETTAKYAADYVAQVFNNPDLANTLPILRPAMEFRFKA
jgi:ABC-type uncharacterized transport system substrate-binding protein